MEAMDATEANKDTVNPLEVIDRVIGNRSWGEYPDGAWLLTNELFNDVWKLLIHIVQSPCRFNVTRTLWTLQARAQLLEIATARFRICALDDRRLKTAAARAFEPFLGCIDVCPLVVEYLMVDPMKTWVFPPLLRQVVLGLFATDYYYYDVDHVDHPDSSLSLISEF